jgi:hypothetical protein
LNKDNETVANIISDKAVNEFNILLDFGDFDSDLLLLKQHYSKGNGG